ncbi:MULTISPECIES: aminodeoxychorismate synthase component I [unclassified Herbaspirillum]|uniref:aminodeoxychorismate synthase component I n=1 Tax=unclassified Herbaspirillum TaxID=2624150 RepID=UPI00114F45EF|nr:MULTISPECIES: aminodeoxychorismate synthase component I [unclassified Herbaspirillum]MBB5391082.1 para-aminobenzoate synthetase/4-amino-4-deoxychorismate lyase [Herbaspirillum sp. SJZ102]TQK13227.1 para-aminobenzoate synthetase/4-amino-4-deoxychorismate lyase [Herbaspirillum sp. SJZ130]TQK15231.1 para-aminobenzoate synthetase/4-amino-4-deoxychorismate lyase [Herbaspirillum sp. SJZ106]
MTACPACFALLDDHLATPAEPRSRLYTGHLRTLACADAAGFPALLAQMEQALAAGQHALALWDYELGAAMQGLPHKHAGGPLAKVMLFQRCDRLSAAETDQWLAQQEQVAPAGIANVAASVSETEFSAAIARIHDYIAAGHTYQVNYTYRLRFDAYGDPLALYRKLRARQPVPYGALVCCEDGSAVLSFSPELFVAHAGGMLKAKPMKGTAPAAPAADADADATNARRALALAGDEKNRAENLMIVDLLRNDLGRIAAPGSVQVPHLFDVRRYGQVLQMTSTIRARLRTDITLAGAIAALYPCGSITGAPKRRTMEIIDELESTPRGLYTGAIGWFDAPRAGGHALGDFCLSVPIRTLQLQAPEGGLRRGVLGVGAGIVHDSDAASEYAECQLKARFLTGLGHAFNLFETMYATREGCRHLDLHLQRLRTSAAAFGFNFDEAAIHAALAKACAGFDSAAAYRLRLALDAQGGITIQHAALAPLGECVKIFLAPHATDSSDFFLRHKSTHRAAYDAAWKDAEQRGGFDLLFFNEKDELTEGGRSNVFIKLDGRWVTPPLEAGLLPGVMRSVLLADPAWDAVERPVSRGELMRAEAIVVCNALRGAVKATLEL